MAPGDLNSDEVAVDLAAESIVQALMLQPTALNSSLSVTGRKGGEGVSQAVWDDEFLKLDGPEVWRQGIEDVSVEACRDFVQKGWSPRCVQGALWQQGAGDCCVPTRARG